MSHDTDIILQNLALTNYEPRNFTEVNVSEILEVSSTPFASKASYCSKSAL